MLRFALFSLFALSLTVWAGCSSKAITPPRQIPEVVVDTVVQRDVQQYIDATGYAEAFEFVQVPARVSGFLREIRFKAGDFVAVDTPLFLIEPDQYKASVDAAAADLESCKSQLDLAKAELARTEELLPIGAKTQSDFDIDKAKRDVAAASVLKAEAALATAQLSLNYTDVRSPIAGKVDRNLVDIGNMVGPGAADILTTVAGMDPIYVYFDISDTEFNRIREVVRETLPEAAEVLRTRLKELRESRDKNTDSATEITPVSAEKTLNIPIMVGLIKGAEPNQGEYPYAGFIDMAGNRIDQSTGTITARGVLPNENYDIYPGQICRIRIPSFTQPGAVLVKEEAIATDMNNKYVFVVDDKNIARRQNVVLGKLESDNMRVIESGLQAGDRYVSVGIQKARDGGEVRPQ